MMNTKFETLWADFFIFKYPSILIFKNNNL